MQGMQTKVGVSPLEAHVAKLEGKLTAVCVEQEFRQFQVLHELNILPTQLTELGSRCPQEEIIAEMEKLLYPSMATLPIDEFEWIMFNHKPKDTTTKQKSTSDEKSISMLGLVVHDHSTTYSLGKQCLPMVEQSRHPLQELMGNTLATNAAY